jgi:hypothetical protein
MTSFKYADKAIGYAVTKGQVLGVRNLDSAKSENLSDGVAVSVANDDCEVTMQFGKRKQVISLTPNSVIIYGGEVDYILQPYGEVGSELKTPESTLTERKLDPAK